MHCGKKRCQWRESDALENILLEKPGSVDLIWMSFWHVPSIYGRSHPSWQMLFPNACGLFQKDIRWSATLYTLCVDYEKEFRLLPCPLNFPKSQSYRAAVNVLEQQVLIYSGSTSQFTRFKGSTVNVLVPDSFRGLVKFMSVSWSCFVRMRRIFGY